MTTRCSLLYSLVALMLCLGAGVRPATAQEHTLTGLADRAVACGVFFETVDRVRSGVSSGTLSEPDGMSLLSPLLKACEKNLPLDPFGEKLEEGLTKRVPPSLIVRALNRKLDEYDHARSLLAGRMSTVDPALLVVLGEGLSKGTPRQDFEMYVAEYSGHSTETFLNGAEMTSLLGQIDFDFKLTRTILDAGFQAGSLTSRWHALVRLVLGARQRGLTDQAIALGTAEVLASGGSLDDVAARLGFTSRDLTGRNNSN